MIKNSFFETIKTIDGEVSHILYHQRRYENVLKSLGGVEYINLLDYLNPPSSGLYRCRLTYDKYNHIDVTYHPYKKRNISSLKIVHADAIEYSQKSTDRTALEELFSLREECDDILIVKNGLVTDTSIANIAFYKDGIWYTPISPLLEGTTRERLLDTGVLTLRDIQVDELQNFSKIALLNAMIDFDIITDIVYKY